ncbi:hypothetical protein AOA14_10705 [Sphingopyxis terrae subsp. terrae NBRC 15098]|uniref:DUF91 domain-containing protein n=1 Tax=Sphingopyxis terrae subsp. terrae NBRC 15098 TaxID=1219058 RepID=A0A142VZ60_9SPHN|nr:hypothetical protein [Sphingopyxis terrae]AMU95074.1 hypothetical protein AOA14_10705 [Sphingopyxis terrae subsp. terrae NBRC 15098]
MTRASIYTVDGSETLIAMRPSEPRSEDFMQRLVAKHPELISDQDGALLLIRREQPIADREDGSGRWSLDHLFVTRTGIPVLVELKRAVDTRLRREVVGQMLDYAANGTAYWQGGRIAENFAATSVELGRDPDVELEQFLGAGADPEQFWEQVDANFAAGRIKMVFVADTIPRELARIVEFLNEQMKADVRAVELTWFEGEGITALAPRIIGETERAQNEKAARSALPKISRDEWIEESLRSFGAEAIEAANHYVDLVAAAGGHAEVTRAQASLIAVFDLPNDTIYPITLSRQGKGSVQLCLAYLVSRPAFADEAVRQHIYDELTAIVGPLSTSKLSGYPGFPLARLNDPAVRRDLQALLVAIRERATARS